MEQSFLDRPFGDLGASRTISWPALGIRWTIGFTNDVETVAVAEEFVASLQIALVALAGHDFCLLPARVHLNISLSGKRPRIKINESKTSNGTVTVDLGIRRELSGKDLRRWSSETLAPIAGVLNLLSVLPTDRLEAVMKEAFLDVAGKIHVALPYRELHREWVDDANFDRDGRQAARPLLADRKFECRSHPQLAPKTGPGPGYSHTEALKRIDIRYEKCVACIGFTARRLMAHPERRKLLMDWRTEGMKDWEILSIIANAAINLRHPLTDDIASETEAIERLRPAFEFVEGPDSAIDPDLITDEMLRGHRRAFQIAYLRSWNLDVQFSKVDEKALETLLIARYGLRSDDVDHSDAFG
jgi:hypothetical protein